MIKKLGINNPLNYEFSRFIKPRLWVKSGESIVVETEDALSGQIKNENDRRDKTKIPWSNPVTGPINVDNSEPGDHLAVTIEEINPLDNQCVTRTAPSSHLMEWLGSEAPHGTHICPIIDDKIFWSEKIIIPYKPMVGCIGTALDVGVQNTNLAGNWGGNMDLIEVCPKNTIFLPVFVKGGFLYLGDIHAAMGHGELSATGLEMSSSTKITITLIKKTNFDGVRIESNKSIMTVASGRPMENSIANAMSHLIFWMEKDYDWNRWKAYDLLTHVASISIGYFGIGTVAVKINKSYLAN